MSKTVNLRLDFYDKRRSAVQRILQPWGGRSAEAAVRPYEAGELKIGPGKIKYLQCACWSEVGSDRIAPKM